MFISISYYYENDIKISKMNGGNPKYLKKEQHCENTSQMDNPS